MLHLYSNQIHRHEETGLHIVVRMDNSFGDLVHIEIFVCHSFLKATFKKEKLSDLDRETTDLIHVK